MFPYVVAWSGLTGQIHVFSLLDQRCVQEIPLLLSASPLHTLYVLSAHYLYITLACCINLVPYYFLLPFSLCMLLLHSFHNVFILEDMLLTLCENDNGIFKLPLNLLRYSCFTSTVHEGSEAVSGFYLLYSWSILTSRSPLL